MLTAGSFPEPACPPACLTTQHSLLPRLSPLADSVKRGLVGRAGRGVETVALLELSRAGPEYTRYCSPYCTVLYCVLY